jgi:hypothetical protein
VKHEIVNFAFPNISSLETPFADINESVNLPKKKSIRSNILNGKADLLDVTWFQLVFLLFAISGVKNIPLELKTSVKITHTFMIVQITSSKITRRVPVSPA